MRSGLMSRRRCGVRIVSSLPGSYPFKRPSGHSVSTPGTKFTTSH
jgi:hypothetical protein